MITRRGRGRVTTVALVVAMSMLAVPAHAAAIGAGTFSPTGSLTTPRSGAAAALLPDGRVLVAGGFGNGSTQSSAELFNPKTGTFTPTGSMGTVRNGLAAAPLPGGKVLVVGGTNGTPFSALDTAEIFDPATGAFTPTGSMGTGRVGPAAAALSDGRVLVAGGLNGFTPLDSAEVFNPQSGSFTTVGSMTTARQGGPTAAPLADGRVLVVGGSNNTGASLASAEVFNPQTNTFSAAGIGSMGTARHSAAATQLPDGRVLVAGGIGDTGGAFTSAEVFNPPANSFSSTGIGSLGTPRELAAHAPLADGRVLIAGGIAGPAMPQLASAEIFAASNSFSFKVKGTKLTVGVQASGKVVVSDVAAKLGASPAKKRRALLLKTARASGDPPKIVLKLKLSKLGNQRLRATGKVKARARITFTPQGGLANTRTAKLKISSKTRR